MAVDGFADLEDNTGDSVKDLESLALPGSWGMACSKSRWVNVGDPVTSSRMEYRGTSITARTRDGLRGSQMGDGTEEAGNDRGGTRLGLERSLESNV